MSFAIPGWFGDGPRSEVDEYEDVIKARKRNVDSRRQRASSGNARCHQAGFTSQDWCERQKVRTVALAAVVVAAVPFVASARASRQAVPSVRH